jgi:hypothetical protein
MVKRIQNLAFSLISSLAICLIGLGSRVVMIPFLSNIFDPSVASKQNSFSFSKRALNFFAHLSRPRRSFL